MYLHSVIFLFVKLCEVNETEVVSVVNGPQVCANCGSNFELHSFMTAKGSLDRAENLQKGKFRETSQNGHNQLSLQVLLRLPAATLSPLAVCVFPPHIDI